MNKIGLKNFRIFDENGVVFELTPITLLTGCNSSGKSSIIKGIMIISDFIQQIINDFKRGSIDEMKNYNLNFINQLYSMGLYDNVKNRFSNSNEIVFSYSKYSVFSNGDLTTEITFVNSIDSEAHIGKIKCIKCSTNNEVLFSYEIENGFGKSNINMIAVKALLINFSFQAQEYLNYKELTNKFEAENGTWHDKNDSYFDDFDEYLNQNNCKKKDYENFENFIYSEVSFLNSRRFLNKNSDNYEKHTASRFARNDSSQTLFQLPIIDFLNSFNKNDIEIQLNKLLKNKGVAELRNESILRVLSDFKNSDFECLLDYYVYYEIKFLENINLIDNYHANTMIGRTLKSIENNEELFNLRSLILEVNPDWKIIEISDDGEYINYNKIGGDDFDFETRKFKEIFKQFQNISLIIDENYKLKNFRPEINGFNDVRVKDFELSLVFLSFIIHDSLINVPSFMANPQFISAERVSQKRIYTKDTNSEFSTILFDLIETIGRFKIEKKRYDLYNNKSLKYYKEYNFTKKWLGKDKFDIADDIEISPIEEGLGVFVKLKRNEKWSLLADEGYGISKIIVILLKIELLILKHIIQIISSSYSYLNKSNLYNEGSTIIIEEPESNLHPKFQSMLADLFDEIAFSNNRRKFKDYGYIKGFNFIIETHSEYFIRKTQLLVKERGYECVPNINPFTVYYIDKANKKQWKMEYREDGKFANEFGPGFYDESSILTLNLL